MASDDHDEWHTQTGTALEGTFGTQTQNEREREMEIDLRARFNSRSILHTFRISNSSIGKCLAANWQCTTTRTPRPGHY